jgi:hypothetical protein
MTDNTLRVFEEAYSGRRCTIQRCEQDWVLSFGGNDGLSVEVPWRIVQEGRIAYASKDDGQKFGLPHPVDGEAVANGLLDSKGVLSLELDRITADLRIHFDGATHIDVFNDSSGCEGWQASFRAGGDGVLIIGMGGGDVTIFRRPNSAQE